MSGPPDYDPRRLFPFGLSPIPEVPSELASEVSSMYSYAPDDDESEAETEVEGAKTPGSIMYSGSCSSVKSNGTLEDKAQVIDSSDSETEEEDETEEESDDDEGSKIIIAALPMDPEVPATMPVQEIEECCVQKIANEVTIDDPKTEADDDEEEEDDSDDDSGETDDDSEEDNGNHYSSCVTAVTHQKRAFNVECGTECLQESGLAIVPSASSSNLDPSPGAITATEIFQHLQATREKNEVTTELAKILNVLQTTLKEDSSSSSSEDTDDSKEATPEPVQKTQPTPQAPLGKPPVYPQSLKSCLSRSGVRRVGPEIQQRIKELASLRPEKGKEEMSILSKILVTLLCSCKSAEASAELRKIIRHFREAANEASDEIEEEMKPIRSSRTSSRGSRRRYRSRSRRSSANSNGSNTSQSEAESLTNTLTPCNTDSKSSGTEDEGLSGPNKRCSVCNTPTNENGKENSPIKQMKRESEEANVTFTVSLPRRPSIEVAEITASISPTKMMMQNNGSNNKDDDEEEEEEEEEEEDEWEWEEDDDAASARSRRSGKRVDSTSSRDLSSAELQKDTSMASSTRKLLTEMECGAYNSDSVCSPGHTSGNSDGVSMSEQSHESPALEGDSDYNIDEAQKDDDKDEEEEEEEDDEEEEEEEEEENLYTHLEETYRVLNGAYQIITGAQTDTVVTKEKATAPTGEQLPIKHNRPPSRPSSKMSRPASRRSIQRGEDGNEEEDWGDEEEGDWEWEYYYEEENGNIDKEHNEMVEAVQSEAKNSPPHETIQR